jgi:multidrug efflux pump subunit AcrA (membrane-fusion protein)
MKRSLEILTVLMGISLTLLPACSGKPAGNGEAQAPGKSEEGKIVLTADAAKTAGIKTDVVQMRTFHPAVKASGTVALNQRRYVKVTPRIPGRVEKVLVFEGDRVRAGQDLFWLWSPDLMAVQAEYLQILGRVESGGANPASEDGKLHEGLLQSTEARLKLMGFGDADVAALRTSRQAFPVLVIRAPIAGTLIEAEAVVGAAAEPATCLGSIADLTSLWVQVNIFEKDLASVAPGSRVEIEVAAYPGEVFQGTLVSIGSLMDEATRTVKARVDAANPDAKLKPGMYADVRVIARDPVTMLSVPEQAVRTIAGKTVVFLPGSGGTFTRRDIRRGRAFEGFVEVLEGLKEGERVVTDGSFDVKAEMLKGTLEGEK